MSMAQCRDFFRSEGTVHAKAFQQICLISGNIPEQSEHSVAMNGVQSVLSEHISNAHFF